MLGKPIIRDLCLADIANWSFIECLSSLSPTAITYKDAENLYFERQHSGIRTIVAVVDSLVIGTASMFIEPKFLHEGSKVAHIEDVSVLKIYQHHGIGQLLMNHLIGLAQTAGCYKVILDCSTKVQPFYEKLGFVQSSNNMRLDLCQGS